MFLLMCHIFNALTSLKNIFNGIASAECIMVPLILNVIFLMYVNFITFGFRMSMFVVSFIQHCNMFYMMDINVYIFLVPTPHV